MIKFEKPANAQTLDYYCVCVGHTDDMAIFLSEMNGLYYMYANKNEVEIGTYVQALYLIPVTFLPQYMQNIIYDALGES